MNYLCHTGKKGARKKLIIGKNFFFSVAYLAGSVTTNLRVEFYTSEGGNAEISLKEMHRVLRIAAIFLLCLGMQG